MGLSSLVIIKLGVLVVNYDFYVKAAEGRHSLYKKLWPSAAEFIFDLKPAIFPWHNLSVILFC